MLVPAFHFLVLYLNVFALWYDQMYLELPLPKSYEGLPFKARCAFLTIWCLVIQTIYFGVALLNDIMGSNAVKPKNYGLLRRTKDLIFSSAFVLALFVSAMFWGLYSMDPEMILPKKLEILYPKWLNHTQHTLIVPFILLELFTSYREYPARRLGLTVMSMLTITYICLSYAIFFKTGAWAYPIFELMNAPGRIAFFAVSVVFAMGIYLIGEKLNSLVWSNRKGTKKTKKN